MHVHFGNPQFVAKGVYGDEVLSYTVKKLTNFLLLTLKNHLHVCEHANDINFCNLCSNILNYLVFIRLLIESSVRGA